MAVPINNKIKSIIREGVSGIKLGSLKYLNAESKIILFTEALNPLIVTTNMIINNASNIRMKRLFNFDSFFDWE